MIDDLQEGIEDIGELFIEYWYIPTIILIMIILYVALRLAGVPIPKIM